MAEEKFILSDNSKYLTLIYCELRYHQLDPNNHGDMRSNLVSNNHNFIHIMSDQVETITFQRHYNLFIDI